VGAVGNPGGLPCLRGRGELGPFASGKPCSDRSDFSRFQTRSMLRRSKIFIAIAAQIAVSSVGAHRVLIVQTRSALNFSGRVPRILSYAGKHLATNQKQATGIPYMPLLRSDDAVCAAMAIKMSLSY